MICCSFGSSTSRYEPDAHTPEFDGGGVVASREADNEVTAAVLTTTAC